MSSPIDDNATLLPPTFRLLPLGYVRPTGWLLRQLRLQADGLSGHLDEFWPDVADSGWIGGAAEGWERGPYWLDGMVPLAFLLDDVRLLAKVQRWMDYILSHQHEDGWLGPVRDTPRGGRYVAYDPWPVFVVLKAMTQYEEASRDARVIPAMKAFLRRLDSLLDERPLFAWGKSRWADLVLSIHWLFDRAPEGWLLDLAGKVHTQGYDWRHHFETFHYPHKVRREQCDQTTHVVNNAMAIKQPGVWYRQSRDPEDREAAFQIIETLDAHHGQVTGLFAGDEHYAGRDPSQGTELCAVVENMFSLETLVSLLGDVMLADRLERIAFNALPATFKPDMWAHQYDQQTNQVICKVSEDNVYTSNGPESNMFGLEPNYGCCTANMHQGWPKFASHLWMGTQDSGVVAVAYAPCTVLASLPGGDIRITVDTEYPFDDRVHITVDPDGSRRFPIYLRIPAWAESAEVQVTGSAPLPTEPGTFARIEQDWNTNSGVTLRLPMQARTQRRYHGSVAVERGPLVYALRIGEAWRLVGGEPPHGDWEVHPTTPWNYALQIDPQHPDRSIRFEHAGVGDRPFSPEGAPVRARVQGRRVSQWGLAHNAAGPLPWSPVDSSEPLEQLTLIPYGCTNLRVTEFPLLA